MFAAKAQSRPDTHQPRGKTDDPRIGPIKIQSDEIAFTPAGLKNHTFNGEDAHRLLCNEVCPNLPICNARSPQYFDADSSDFKKTNITTFRFYKRLEGNNWVWVIRDVDKERFNKAFEMELFWTPRNVNNSFNPAKEIALTPDGLEQHYMGAGAALMQKMDQLSEGFFSFFSANDYPLPQVLPDQSQINGEDFAIRVRWYKGQAIYTIPIEEKERLGKALECLTRNTLVHTESSSPPVIPPAENPRTGLSAKTPLPHQKTAVEDNLKILNKPGADVRATTVMACGTGKTFVTYWTAKELGLITLYTEPSLALIAQNMTEIKLQASLEGEIVDFLVVCSDPSVTKINHDEPDILLSDLRVPVTNSPKEIIAFLKNGGGRKIVFSTLHSTPLIAEAMRQDSSIKFDCTVVDEAHRTVGDVESAFTTVLDQRQIRSRTRLFTTATPKVYSGDYGENILSMDNEKVYGPRAHTLTFGKAVKDGLLCDYQVVVAGLPKKEGELLAKLAANNVDIELATRDLAFLRVVQKHKLSKVVSFHQTVKKAHGFAVRIKGYVDSKVFLLGRHVEASGIDGKMSSGDRTDLLKRFRMRSRDEFSLLSNCRVLREGLDVPAMDSVAFLDKRESEIDIIQGIGRAIRKDPNNPGKQVGTIIIPIIVPEGVDDESILDSSEFKRVWQVLKALRAHDEKFEVRCKLKKGGTGRDDGGGGEGPNPVEIDIQNISELFRGKIDAKVVRVGCGIRRSLLTEAAIIESAREYCRNHGRLPSCQTTHSVPGMPNETWSGLDAALSEGVRGLPGKSSLSKLFKNLKEELGLNLKERAILEAGRKYYYLHFRLPNEKTKDPVPDMPHENWKALDASLRAGSKGLPGGSSLAKLFKNIKEELGFYYIDKILDAAKTYYKESQKFPTSTTEDPVPGMSNVTWKNLDARLRSGARCLPGNSSLSLLLEPWKAEIQGDISLSEFSIIRALEIFHEIYKKRPRYGSGQTDLDLVPGMPNENWHAIDAALRKGSRGLPGGSSLLKLFHSLGI